MSRPEPATSARGKKSSARPVSSWLIAGAAAGVAGLAAYATLVEPRWLEVTHQRLPVPGLPAAWEGLRIGHVTDFHLSPLADRRPVIDAIELVQAEQPDLIAFTGDFMSRDCRYPGGERELLAGLSAPLGVYAVLGNHDHESGPERVSAMAEEAGLTMLRNRCQRLEREGEPLWLLGIDSMEGQQYRRPAGYQEHVDGTFRGFLADAAAGITAPGPRILLAHSPDIIEFAPDHSVDLVLCGHTHGGQVRFPWVGATIVPSKFGRRYAAGLFRERGTWLYVNRGVGTVRLPIRFLCRPEVAIITLEAAEETGS